MVVIVKKIQPNMDFLKLTGHKDYFLINGIFSSKSEGKGLFRLFQTILLLNKPCENDDQLRNGYVFLKKHIAD